MMPFCKYIPESYPFQHLECLVNTSIKVKQDYFPISTEKLKNENKTLYDIVLKRIGKNEFLILQGQKFEGHYI